MPRCARARSVRRSGRGRHQFPVLNDAGTPERRHIRARLSLSQPNACREAPPSVRLDPPRLNICLAPRHQLGPSSVQHRSARPRDSLHKERYGLAFCGTRLHVPGTPERKLRFFRTYLPGRRGAGRARARLSWCSGEGRHLLLAFGGARPRVPRMPERQHSRARLSPS